MRFNRSLVKASFHRPTGCLAGHGYPRIYQHPRPVGTRHRAHVYQLARNDARGKAEAQATYERLTHEREHEEELEAALARPSAARQPEHPEHAQIPPTTAEGRAHAYTLFRRGASAVDSTQAVVEIERLAPDTAPIHKRFDTGVQISALPRQVQQHAGEQYDRIVDGDAANLWAAGGGPKEGYDAARAWPACLAKVTRGGGFRGTLEYLHGEGHHEHVGRARTIGGNMGGTTPRALAAEFGIARQMRPAVKKPVLHISLALPPDEHLTDERWCTVAHDFLQKMEVDTNIHQWHMVRHSETEHDHMHLVINRIGLDGSLWAGQWEAKRRSAPRKSLANSSIRASACHQIERNGRTHLCGDARKVIFISGLRLCRNTPYRKWLACSVLCVLPHTADADWTILNRTGRAFPPASRERWLICPKRTRRNKIIFWLPCLMKYRIACFRLSSWGPCRWARSYTSPVTPCVTSIFRPTPSYRYFT